MTLYEITNTVTGMGYVGITKKKPKYRWRSHKKALRTGKHHNKWLQRAYDRYGSEAFEYKIRQICNSIEELSNLEKKIVKEEKLRLYNIKEGGYDAPFVKHTEKTKRKLSEARKKPVIGMSIKTGEIKEYSCAKNVKLDGFNPAHIGECCKSFISKHNKKRVRQYISVGKWVWMHKSEFSLTEMERRREMAKCRGNQSRAIIGKSLINGSIVRFTSCVEAGRFLGTHGVTIRNACVGGEHKSCAQHVWVFADSLRPTILLEERYVYAMDTFNGYRVTGPKSKRATIKKV